MTASNRGQKDKQEDCQGWEEEEKRKKQRKWRHERMRKGERKEKQKQKAVMKICWCLMW